CEPLPAAHCVKSPRQRFNQHQLKQINRPLHHDCSLRLKNRAHDAAFDSQCRAVGCRRERARSEEHTSELQSRFDLVCCLLLENTRSSSLFSWRASKFEQMPSYHLVTSL